MQLTPPPFFFIITSDRLLVYAGSAGCCACSKQVLLTRELQSALLVERLYNIPPTCLKDVLMSLVLKFSLSDANK